MMVTPMTTPKEHLVNTPLISVVTGTYNRLALLQSMIASVRREIPTGIPYEIVVCDGGSSDGSLDWLKAQADVVLIEHGALRGAITAFTDAAHQARGKYVVLANDDVEFKPLSLAAALVHLEDTPACGAVAFKDNRAKGGGYDVSKPAASSSAPIVAV